MTRDLIDILDEINTHLAALTSLTLAVDNLEDAGQEEIECVAVTMKYHVEKARELHSQLAEQCRTKGIG